MREWVELGQVFTSEDICWTDGEWHCQELGNKLACKEGHSGPTYESMQAVFDLKNFRPAVNLSNPTITNISFTLYAVLGVNEKTQILTTFLWLRLYWQHEFLVWDPDECDGVTRISLPVRELWTPDIIVYEFVDDDVSQACPYVYLNHTGRIRWDRMLRLVSACNLEIFSFPFDVQNCTFTFGSYMHTIRDVRITPALTFKQMSENSKRYLEASGEWELVDILGETSILKFGVDEWDIITFWVVIKRQPMLYVVNLLIPSSFLMLIDILSFYLPPHSVDRASFKMTLILGYTVFLLIMNDLLPSTANGTPIIGIYFSVCLALMVISLLETVIITNVLHHSTMKYKEVPNWVRVVVLKHIGNLICYRFPEDIQPPYLSQMDKPENSNGVPESCIIQPASQKPTQHPTINGAALPELQQICQYLGDLRAHLTSLQKESELQGQWCHVGYVLDLLLFRIYLLLISCYALVIICMWCIWIHQTSTDVRMIQGPTPEEILKESQDVLQTNGEWELTGISVATSTLELNAGGYSVIKYYIILKRRPMLYVVNLLIPSCFLITVDLCSFLLPPQTVDRSSFKMTLILGYTVFLLIMNDLLPVTGETTPLINVLFSISLALMVSSLLETVLITKVQCNSSQYRAVPRWLSVLVLRYLAVVVFLPRKKKSNKTTVFLNPSLRVFGDTLPVNPPPEPALDELRKLSRDLLAIRLQVDKHSQGNQTSQEWHMIGTVIDRLLFGLYIVFIAVSFIAIICIWSNQSAA
ncbi:5-hydroxytryptamine receptor 3A-like [Etheostoma cragini]|uniref:5-hydroxytryptamine receptor 3A-like n=1 Tax=Etheostoma cragini TaxID=417921 RepID=UPI00155E30C6|nr:5-hydroxytryptamine receptor 3A-like [Etheostoma cragini]